MSDGPETKRLTETMITVLDCLEMYDDTEVFITSLTKTLITSNARFVEQRGLTPPKKNP